MKIKQLIKILREKDQNAELEFIIVKKNGGIVAMNINIKAKDFEAILKHFSGRGL